MSYVFSDQQAKLSSLLGDSNTATDDMWPLSVRKKELNRGELQFAKDALYLGEYVTGAVASNEISLPANWLKTFSLVVNNVQISDEREISINDYERYYNYAGSPPYFYYWRFSDTRKIKFIGNVNGQTYALYYFKRPTTELDADADVSIHDEEYREAPCFYAASQLLSQIGKTQMADRYMSQYMKLVRDAQLLAEQHFLRKDYPHPDVNIVGGSTTNDIQGQGW